MSIKDAFGADSTEPEQECFWFPDRLFWCQTWDSFMSFLMIWESAAHMMTVSLIRHNHHLSAYSASYSWAVNVMWRHDWDVRACLRSAQMWMSLTRCSFVLFVLHRVFVVLPNNCVHTNSQKSLSSSALCPPNMCMDMFSINESSKYLHVFIIAVIWIFKALFLYKPHTFTKTQLICSQE